LLCLAATTTPDVSMYLLEQMQTATCADCSPY